MAAAKPAPKAKATAPDLSQGPPAKGAPTIADVVAATEKARAAKPKIPVKGGPTIADVVADAVGVGLLPGPKGPQPKPGFKAPQDLPQKASPKPRGRPRKKQTT